MTSRPRNAQQSARQEQELKERLVKRNRKLLEDLDKDNFTPFLEENDDLALLVPAEMPTSAADPKKLSKKQRLKLGRKSLRVALEEAVDLF